MQILNFKSLIFNWQKGNLSYYKIVLGNEIPLTEKSITKNELFQLSSLNMYVLINYIYSRQCSFFLGE